jgi:hypothetical protein
MMMVDTLDEKDLPYRSGDSDKVERKVLWPNIDDAKRRVTVLINNEGIDVKIEMEALDLLVLMREIGRLTAENAELSHQLKEK